MEPDDELERDLRRRARDAAGKAVVRRARHAIAVAEQAIARARVLQDGRRLARDPATLMRRCAWCGRVTLGGEWVDADEARRVVAGRNGDPEISHTICPDCTDELVREGRSH